MFLSHHLLPHRAHPVCPPSLRVLCLRTCTEDKAQLVEVRRQLEAASSSPTARRLPTSPRDVQVYGCGCRNSMLTAVLLGCPVCNVLGHFSFLCLSACKRHHPFSYLFIFRGGILRYYIRYTVCCLITRKTRGRENKTKNLKGHIGKQRMPF